ncbi:retrovirus-related pol polyprotein from transposon 17.6 [Tanacetum coccineum]
MNGNWNKRRIDNSILRSNNANTDSFFKPYLITHGKSDTKKEDKQSQTKRKYSNTFNSIDEQPNKRRCKEEKFEAIQYSLRPNEEYIAIRGYEFDIWERNDDNLSIIYQDIFSEKETRMKVNLDNSTSNVLIPLDSWTSGLLEYKFPLRSSITINRGLIQAISTSLPPQPIGEAIKAFILQRIPSGASQSPVHLKITSKYAWGIEEQSNQGLGDWFEVELEKCWNIQQKRNDSHLNLRRQAGDDALRKWEAQIDQLRREEHEVSECMMVYISKNDVHKKETSQIERISSLPKKPNPGSLTIPCLVDIFSINAIADLGASINIMSESMLDELSLADPKHANIIVEMADKTRCVSQGIVENVLVKIDKFSFTSDFIIIDTKELNSKPIILGRPFLANIHTEINISTREVSLGIK